MRSFEEIVKGYGRMLGGGDVIEGSSDMSSKRSWCSFYWNVTSILLHSMCVALWD